MLKIGITERGDGGLDQSWKKKMSTVDGAIIITKAPQLLDINTLPKNTIIHCTITGFGGTKIEPNVAKPETTLKAWREIKEVIGQERVVLRIDPIIPEYSTYALNIAKNANETDRIRISFLDLYSHARKRMISAGINLSQQFHAPIKTKNEILKLLPPQTEICAEPGMKCTGCISQRDLNAMGIIKTSRGKCIQRKECMCIAEKTELLTERKQCKHGCLYCYWK